MQTLIYFYDPIEVEQDQLIEGSITLSQSKENARFMNIHLEYSWVITGYRPSSTLYIVKSELAYIFHKLIFFPCSSGGRSFVKESVMRWFDSMESVCMTVSRIVVQTMALLLPIAFDWRCLLQRLSRTLQTCEFH